jgi:transposase InsO family protein
MVRVVGEFTRECFSIDVERSLTAEDVVASRRLSGRQQRPDLMRSDNGPEFIALAVKEWLKDTRIKMLYIEPGSLWENAYSETFNSRFQDKLLNREIFSNLAEPKVLEEEHR